MLEMPPDTLTPHMWYSYINRKIKRFYHISVFEVIAKKVTFSLQHM